MSACPSPPEPTPAGAPTVLSVRLLPYGNPPVNWTVTLSPWPSGVGLALATSTATDQAPKNFCPGAEGTFNHESVSAFTDGHQMYIGGNLHNLALEGIVSPFTSSASTPSLASDPIVTSSSTPAPTSSVTPGGTSSMPTSTLASNGTIPRGKSGLDGGAVAGVAIGCLIAGALIAGLVLWLCCGRRKQRRTRNSEISAIGLMPHGKGPVTHTTSLGSRGTPLLSTTGALPQPLEDRAISGEISKISNLIKNHVQSYYHSRAVNPGLVDLDDINALGNTMPISTGTLSTLIDKTATREAALRFCIAWAIVSRLQSHEKPKESLLPQEVCLLLREIARADRKSKSHHLMTARWRVATAQLLETTYIQNAFAPSDSRNDNIQALAYVLENVLQLFVDARMNNEQRKRNLEEILKRSAIFAFTLFSQMSSWDFDWKEEQGVKSSELCIFPALVQINDDAGESVRPPRSFSEAVVRKLDS